MNEITPDNIRALSWKQPFASLMLHGKIETRTWPTKYRGLVLICASKQPYSGAMVQRICGELQTYRLQTQYLGTGTKNHGQAIAVGNLVECRPMQNGDDNACFVEYHEGLWCHVYTDVKAIEPFDFKGGMKWKKLTQEQIEQIKYK